MSKVKLATVISTGSSGARDDKKLADGAHHQHVIGADDAVVAAEQLEGVARRMVELARSMPKFGFAFMLVGWEAKTLAKQIREA